MAKRNPASSAENGRSKHGSSTPNKSKSGRRKERENGHASEGSDVKKDGVNMVYVVLVVALGELRRKCFCLHGVPKLKTGCFTNSVQKRSRFLCSRQEKVKFVGVPSSLALTSR